MLTQEYKAKRHVLELVKPLPQYHFPDRIISDDCNCSSPVCRHVFVLTGSLSALDTALISPRPLTM